MILFHVAIGLKSGLGHLSRCITLLKEVKKNQMFVSLFLEMLKLLKKY